MKTSEFEKIMDKSGLEVESINDYIFINQYVAINEKTQIATISTEYPLKFSILKPFLVDEKVNNAIIDYAKTSIDERIDEIKTTFFSDEIEFAKKFIDHVSEIECDPAIGHFQMNTYKFVIYGQDDYESLLRIMSKASGNIISG